MPSFWDKIRSKWAAAEPGADLELSARMGEQFEALVEDPKFQILLDEILGPLQKEAFEAFTKLDPSDLSGIAQTQKVNWVVEQIKTRIERKIDQGRHARAQILQKKNEEASQ